MARFYGGVSGRAKSSATRLGSQGLRTFCQGWNRGIRVSAWRFTADDSSDVDTFTVTVNGGSNGSGRSATIAYVEGDTITLYHPVSGRVLSKTKLS